MERHTIGNYFNKMKERADSVFQSKEETTELLNDADKKSGSENIISELSSQVKALVRLVKSYRQGTYRNISKKSVMIMVAGLLYFVSPVDAIPDFLVGLGFADDAAVLGFIFRSLKGEIESFTEWERKEKEST
ncbi:YkvA family protein [Fictibacillus iocasae]|uniref:YkvA family protein n=1 Tax=Fictibacillus iocasae TaxID=2715437 RepID=A0ABW2NU18_9BACL